MTDRRAWVGCLSCYNAGRLHGEWLDAVDAADWACERPGHEEMWVMDHEGLGLSGECSPTEAAERAAALDEWEADTGYPEAVLLAAADHQGVPVTEVDADEVLVLASGDSEVDATREYVEESGLLHEVDDSVARYFDYAAYWRDLDCGGVTAVRDGDTVYLMA